MGVAEALAHPAREEDGEADATGLVGEAGEAPRLAAALRETEAWDQIVKRESSFWRVSCTSVVRRGGRCWQGRDDETHTRTSWHAAK